MSYSISICMPVYNCGAYLGQALESILPQAGDDVEIVIYDGGSTDDTPQVVSRYLKTAPHLRYHRGGVRGGIDADLASCVSRASGDYCWLFSGDDVMRPGALKRAIEAVRSGHDVYVCQHTECDIDMVYRSTHPVLAPQVAYIAEWSDEKARHEWFRRAANTEAFFSFLSGLVIRRTLWLAGRLIPEYDGSCWAHVARLFEVAGGGLSVSFVPEVWLDRRGDNDSFRDKGMVDRLRLAIEGFQRMGDHFFSPNSVEAFHIRRVLRTEFTLRMFLIQKLTTAAPALRSERQLLDRIVRATYRDRSVENIAKAAIYRFSPLWSVRWAIVLRRRT